MTTAASELEQLLAGRYPSLRFQRVNCRRIAGSLTWSQHSWPGGNGRDIFGPDLAPSPGSQALLDQVASYLRANRTRFGIKVILWRVPDHYNHIHADMWPTGWGLPPCAGGEERYRYSDGRIVYAYNGRVRPQGIFEPPMSFTPAEELWLKRLAAHAKWLTEFSAEMAKPGPTTGIYATPQSLVHPLEVHRLVAQDAQASGIDHEKIKAHLLGQ